MRIVPYDKLDTKRLARKEDRLNDFTQKYIDIKTDPKRKNLIKNFTKDFNKD